MKHFYTAPTATVAATPPLGHWTAIVCPGAPQWSVVLVYAWESHDAEDAWNALPQVSEHYPENMGALAPAVGIQAFAPWGATAGMTLRQLFIVIKTNWPVWRP